ncbi:hypothetical protein V1264_013091 [Littorina saxatilis]|uniref:Laminin G domain-containing protein n=2 Tax=Littorina saxatilis TaxID=31220 RepID=A0AAN9BPQ6_9CAEN
MDRLHQQQLLRQREQQRLQQEQEHHRREEEHRRREQEYHRRLQERQRLIQEHRRKEQQEHQQSDYKSESKSESPSRASLTQPGVRNGAPAQIKSTPENSGTSSDKQKAGQSSSPKSESRKKSRQKGKKRNSGGKSSKPKSAGRSSRRKPGKISSRSKSSPTTFTVDNSETSSQQRPSSLMAALAPTELTYEEKSQKSGQRIKLKSETKALAKAKDKQTSDGQVISTDHKRKESDLSNSRRGSERTRRPGHNRRRRPNGDGHNAEHGKRHRGGVSSKQAEHDPNIKDVTAREIEHTVQTKERQASVQSDKRQHGDTKRHRGRQRSRGRQSGRRRDRERDSGAGRHTSSASDVPRRPAAADRLERRLFPSVTSSTRELLRSMQRVLSTLSGGLGGVKADNDFVFNGTRYIIMMGVREQLTEIAKANDMVYDTVLRTSLLTKEIFLRAHQSRLTGPTTRSLSRPEMNLPSLYDVRTKAYQEERLAKQLIRTVEDIQRRRNRLQARLRQVTEAFQDGFARNDLRTLVYYVNSTSQRLTSELGYSTHATYIKRNNAMLYGSRDDLRTARDLLYKAGDHLVRGVEDYRGNYRVVEDYRRYQSDEEGVGPPVSLRRRSRSVSPRNDQPIGELSPEERARLRPIIDRLKRHAREQKRLALQIERILRPAITNGQSIASRDDIAASALFTSIASRLDRDGKKMYSLLDSIRVLIGAEGELRWTSTLPAACREDNDDTEGSDCLEEGSGGLVLEGGEGEEEGSGSLPSVATDDEDFVFVDNTKPPKPRRKPSSLVQFGRQLSVYVDGVKLGSNDVSQRADLLKDTTEALSERWAQLKQKYDRAEQTHRSWRETKQIMRNVTDFADDISELASVFSDEVTRSHDSIKTRMKKAVKIAEKRMAEVQARKTGGGGAGASKPETERPANDDTVIVEAVEKVQKARKEWGNVRTLRAVTPQSCGRAGAQVMRLHANISHLKQQVNTAKALLRSMQLSIAKAGSGYLSIPVSQKAPLSLSSTGPSLTPSPSPPPSVSMVTTIEVCIRTQNTEGPVLLIKGNNSATFSIDIDSSELSVTVFDAAGYELETVTSDVTMVEDRWYNVKIIRTGKRLLLRVMPRDGKEESVENDVTVESMTYLQPNPVHVYVGGVADGEPFSVGSDTWRGCLGELHVNGRAVSLFHESSRGEGPQICASQCTPQPEGSSLVFDGVGFLHFPASVLPMRTRMQSVHFRFRSRQATAALLHLVNKRQRFMLRVMLADGALMIDTTTPTESITLRSQRNDYNDGFFHSLKIQYRDSTTYPEIDGVDGAFTIERSRPHNVNNMADGVVVGAFVTGSHAFEKSKYRPLMGCLQGLEIDNKPLLLSQAVTSTGVFSGTCDPYRLWSQCVQFVEGSEGIDLGSLDRSATVVLLFSSDARGPLLAYSREGKYEAQISATDDGLQVTTEEDELSIDRPDDVTNHFVMLTVTDDGTKVTCSAWEQEVATTYGGFWFAQAKKDGAHNVQIGLSVDLTSGAQLFGQLSQVMVGDRYIDLTNYTLSNNLESCRRPLPTLVTSETQPEVTKPDEEDVEATCSMDIKC